jgi:hypothetical protein
MHGTASFLKKDLTATRFQQRQLCIENLPWPRHTERCVVAP